MAEKTKTASVEAEVTKSDEKPKDREFPINVLRSNSIKLFGITSSTFDGAFFGEDASVKITIADAQKKINTWLGKEIK
jgi:hypothetical protein